MFTALWKTPLQSHNNCDFKHKYMCSGYLTKLFKIHMLQSIEWENKLTLKREGIQVVSTSGRTETYRRKPISISLNRLDGDACRIREGEVSNGP